MNVATKPINFANFQYISPSREKGKGGIRHLRGKLRYFQYRNDKSDHVAHERGKPRPERWTDHGLGGNYADILKSCQELQGADVLAWTWVISPAPDLMSLVPEAMRREFVKQLTENVVTNYYDLRDVDVPRYSYVLHDRDTEAGEQQLHTHVVLPGTVETLLGRQDFYNNDNKGHVTLFNQIADQQLEMALDQAVGPQWRSLREMAPEFPELDSELDKWFGPKDAAPDFEVPTEFTPDGLDLDR